MAPLAKYYSEFLYPAILMQLYIEMGFYSLARTELEEILEANLNESMAESRLGVMGEMEGKDKY